VNKQVNLQVATASLLAVWLASACDSSETPEPGSSTGGTTQSGGKSNTAGVPSQTGGGATGGTSGGSTGTPGCNGNANPPTSPTDGYLTIDVNGTSRTYVLELSSGYDGKTPQPVLIALHGTGTTAQEFLGAYYGNVRAGVAGRAILVGPQGLSRSGQTGWASDQSDFAFFDALVTQLKGNYCVDPGRIFAIGHSAGAYFSNGLGCERSNVLRGIAPVAGGGPDGNCGGKVAAFIVHNPAETLVVWATYGWPTTQFWTNKDGCGDIGAMPTAAFPGDSTTGNPLPCKAFAGCDPNYPVTLCLHSYTDQYDGAHAFPPQWAGRAAMDFFLALPKVP
jgi:polyhydroxybutyrate depolymerase